MNFCKDCKWFKKKFLIPARLGRCDNPKNLTINIVTGETRPILEFAENVRIFHCNGDWFEE